MEMSMNISSRANEEHLNQLKRRIFNLELKSFDEIEILYLILHLSKKNESIEHIANLLESYQGNVYQLCQLGLTELVRSAGSNEDAALFFHVLNELSIRLRYQQVEKARVTDSQAVYKVFYPDLCQLGFEEFWVLALNQNKEIERKFKLSSGSVNCTLVDPKKLFHLLLQTPRTTSFILIHNHPSGQKKPSTSDIKITEKIKRASSFFDLEFLDHLIFTDQGYYSFADHNQMIA